MEKTKEKSEQQAEIIKMIAFPVIMLDVEYCKEIATDFMNQASRQESMAVLNPSHPQEKNDILRLKGMALRSLCEYVETLKQIDEMEKTLVSVGKAKADIEKLFL